MDESLAYPATGWASAMASPLGSTITMGKLILGMKCVATFVWFYPYTGKKLFAQFR